MTAHNRQADSLSFQSSFLKPGAGGWSVRKGTLVEHEQKQRCLRPRLPWRERQSGLQPSKRGAAAPSTGRAERRTRLDAQGT